MNPRYSLRRLVYLQVYKQYNISVSFGKQFSLAYKFIVC